MSVRPSFKNILLALAASLAVAATAAGGAHAAAVSMERAFWAQDWRHMDALFAEVDATSRDFFPKKMEARDLSLYMNGLWRQGKYEAALGVLDMMAASDQPLPDEVAPYAQLLRVLGLERTGRGDEAVSTGEALWDGAPRPMRYYLAFAMARVHRAAGRGDEAMKWFRRMFEHADDKKSRLRALIPMSEMGGMTPREAAALVIDSPRNAKALAICRAVPKGSDTLVEYALGWAAYTSKNYKDAMARFAAASSDPEYGEAARYYRGFAAFRVGAYDTAFDQWAGIAMRDRQFPQRSVARLITLAAKANKAKIIELFKRVAAGRDDYPELAADALAALIRIGGDRDATEARAKLFTMLSAADQAAAARWGDGWAAWKAGRAADAEKHWAAGWSERIHDRELGSRLLYWRARALDRLGRRDEADKVRASLVANYPSEYYTFMVDDRGGIKDAPVPASLDISTPLEQWGFVTHARLEAAAAAKSDDTAALYRASKLAAWEGDYSSSVRTCRTLLRIVPTEGVASSELLKMAFPRAFEADVAAATKRTGLAPEYIWGIMRQESMYEPDVTSSAGAYGLMQLMPSTANAEEKKMKLPKDSYKDPSRNIMIGAHHFVGLLAAFKQSVQLSLAAYNAGGGRARKWSEGGIKDMAEWVEDIPFNETRGYVKAVMKNISVYRILYGKGATQKN